MEKLRKLLCILKKDKFEFFMDRDRDATFCYNHFPSFFTGISISRSKNSPLSCCCWKNRKRHGFNGLYSIYKKGERIKRFW